MRDERDLYDLRVACDYNPYEDPSKIPMWLFITVPEREDNRCIIMRSRIIDKEADKEGLQKYYNKAVSEDIRGIGIGVEFYWMLTDRNMENILYGGGAEEAFDIKFTDDRDWCVVSGFGNFSKVIYLPTKKSVTIERSEEFDVMLRDASNILKDKMCEG